MNIFIEILNLSLVSSYVILLVLAVRLLLKKAPKIYSYMLWIVVFVRLICSFTFEIPIGLIPESQPIQQDIIYQTIPTITSEINMVIDSDNQSLPPITQPEVSVKPLQLQMLIARDIWFLGVCLMLGYSLFSYVRLKKNLIGSMYLSDDNIYISDYITSPFVIDIIRPKIYLPSDVKSTELDYIITHEKTHIRRFDHITRVIAFVILSLHWFNPLVWIAYVLSGKDMELSCDESVMKQTSNDIRKEYSQSLLNFATGRVITTPAFGVNITIDTKERIKNIMNFKKPVVWVSALAVTSVAVLSIGCMSSAQTEVTSSIQQTQEVTSPTQEKISKINTPVIINISDEKVSVGFDDIELAFKYYDNPLHKNDNLDVVILEDVRLFIEREEVYLGEKNEGHVTCSEVDNGKYLTFSLLTDIDVTSENVLSESIFIEFTFDDTMTLVSKEISSYFDDIITTEEIVKLATEIYDYAKSTESGLYHLPEKSTVDETNPIFTFEKDGVIVTAQNNSNLFQQHDNITTITLIDVELSIDGEDIYLSDEKTASISCHDNGDSKDYFFKLSTHINRTENYYPAEGNFAGEYIVHNFTVDNDGITVTQSLISDYFIDIIDTEVIENICMNLYEYALENIE